MRVQIGSDEFTRLRSEILLERDRLITRLREIDQVLGSEFRSKRFCYGLRTPTGRAKNSVSLKEAVMKVIEGKSMTKQDILDAVLASGYEFTTDDPLNSLGVVLYGRNPKFKRDGRKFRL